MLLPHVFWNFVWSIASLWPKNLFLLYSSMEKMFDIQKIAKVLASKRLKNIPTEYFASYIGFLLLNFNFDINKKIGFKKCFLGFHIGGNIKFIWRTKNIKFGQYWSAMSKNCAKSAATCILPISIYSYWPIAVNSIFLSACADKIPMYDTFQMY